MRLSPRSLQHPPCRSAGFNLVELLVWVVISSVVLTAAVSALLALVHSDTSRQQDLNRKDNVERVLGLLQDEIRNAQRVETGSVTAPLARLDATNCPTSTVTTLLILRGSSPAANISYGLDSRVNTSFNGPAVLVRCGLPYTNDALLDSSGTATRTEQVVLDNVTSQGFTATAASASAGTVSRNLAVAITTTLLGTATTRTIQVPINVNPVYSVLSSGNSCASSSGCIDPANSSRYFTLALGSNVSGVQGSENVVYIDGNSTDYTLSGSGTSARCTSIQCTVSRNSQSSSLAFVDVLVFRDREIRLPD